MLNRMPDLPEALWQRGMLLHELGHAPAAPRSQGLHRQREGSV